jgi:hypothetical protein
MTTMTRREALITVSAAAAASAAAPPEIPDAILRRHDAAVQGYLEKQVTDEASRWSGGMADATGLYHVGTASGLVNAYASALIHPRSRYSRDQEVMRRLRLAARFLERSQTPDGNINLLTTNFNSPPDTGFVVWNVAEAASIARKYNAREIEHLVQPFLRNAAKGMTQGGVHTPNHRWVVCSALSQIHELWPDAALLKRIDQWLAEGIDIDEDNQFTERSSIYSNVCDRAFVTMAAKLKRPELLDPVRRNLGTMLYMLHPGYDVVTEISRRQDLNQRQDMGKFWFPLRAMAVWDKNRQFAAIAEHFEASHANLATILDYPELAAGGPEPLPVPDNYEKVFQTIGLARVRRGLTSASILLGGTSRFFTFRRGDAVIEAVRFASAFFGKGQFVPETWSKAGESYVLRQQLEAGYYQPLEEPVHVVPENWRALRSKRRVTEVCKLGQTATVTETKNGFRLRLQAEGTPGVPLAVEIGFGDGGSLTGAERVGAAWVLRQGAVTCKAGKNTIRVGPGRGEHNYIDVRGAEPRLPGQSVYITGYTPFDHTLEIEVV